MEKDPRTHKIIGAAIEVHNEMGPGHLEAVYHECLEINFGLKDIPFVSKPRLILYFKNLVRQSRIITQIIKITQISVGNFCKKMQKFICNTIKLKKYYEPDFLVFEQIVLEIKAQKTLTQNDEAQIINSLKSSRHQIGLLINFGEQSLKFRRFIYSQ